MQFLRKFLDQKSHHFNSNGRWEKFYPLYEMFDSFLYTSGKVTTGTTHIRDAMDLKRMMITVGWALFPCIIMAIYNTGLQANEAIETLQILNDQTWRGSLLMTLGIHSDPSDLLSNISLGFLYFFPIYLVTNIVGGAWEALFAVVRKHEINEGFLVTGLLFPLTLPPSIPLWQVAVGISFGIVVGKEIFGGTGKNFLNPALTARAFLFFAYPAEISGDLVWIATDGITAATPLAQASVAGLEGIGVSWSDAFWGNIPGSMGETSTFACLLGAFFLLITGIASWRIMLSILISAMLSVMLLHLIGNKENLMFSLPFIWHVVLGGFAFGTIFMATDPVSSSMTFQGQFFYGALVGFMVILIRLLNPAFSEGMMLAILFSNTFAPLIDYFVIKRHITSRRMRSL